MQARIATSSVSPYMWIVKGPSPKAPESGEGIEAMRPVTRRGFCPAFAAPARGSGGEHRAGHPS